MSAIIVRSCMANSYFALIRNLKMQRCRFGARNFREKKNAYDYANSLELNIFWLQRKEVGIAEDQ